ncbi:MAG: Na+/H+ antiporter NhaC family protein [Bacteroidaceae bacterium]|nr:Na+/H+ antiporter NhaC family protein [Bacteroidaceae bacterium]
MLALTPILIFLLVYLATSLLAGDFYAMPITLAFVVAAAYSVALIKGKKLEERVEIFSKGAMHTTTMLMIWIFVLAGAFAQTAKSMGAIDSLVGALLHILPSQAVPVSMFIAACLVSMSVGTSVGTIVTLVPIAAGLGESIGMPVGMMTAIIVGGAYFGDNLSFISDTTIVATTSQGCKLNDKFKANIYIALPAAIVCAVLYFVIGMDYSSAENIPEIHVLTILPYLLVIVTAICGLNVMVVLSLGIVASFIVAIATGSLGFLDWCKSAGEGILGMGELIIVVLLASGIMGVIKHLGGIDYIVEKMIRRVSTKRSAEFSFMLFIWLVNLCTANNTVTLITTSDIIRQISQTLHIDPRRAASVMDTSSCIIQGVLPYGAQMLMAAALVKLSPLEILPGLYYIYVLAVVLVISIALQFPKRYTAVSSQFAASCEAKGC